MWHTCWLSRAVIQYRLSFLNKNDLKSRSRYEIITKISEKKLPLNFFYYVPSRWISALFVILHVVHERAIFTALFTKETCWKSALKKGSKKAGHKWFVDLRISPLLVRSYVTAASSYYWANSLFFCKNAFLEINSCLWIKTASCSEARCHAFSASRFVESSALRSIGTFLPV